MIKTGYALTILAALFLAMDITMKLLALTPVLETQAQLGWPASPEMARLLGTILLISTALYLWPRTAVLGAVMLTGYFGGAIASHLRINSPLFSHVLFGVYVGLFVWGGLWLRRPDLRALFPINR